MLRSIVLFVSFILLLSGFISCDETSISSSFDFYGFLDGNWEISKSSATFSTGDVRSHSIRGRYEFAKRNDSASLALQGSYYDNDTETHEVSNQLRVAVEFQDSSSGIFSTGSDEDSMKELFRFSFVQPAFNGVPISVGEWHGGAASYYQFQCISPTSFIITVTPKSFGAAQTGESAASSDDDDNGVTIYTARKIIPVSPKTFWQSYGTFVMIGAFFVFNTWMKGKSAAMQQSASPAAGAAVQKKDN